jgi:hypothetical protein
MAGIRAMGEVAGSTKLGRVKRKRKRKEEIKT